MKKIVFILAMSLFATFAFAQTKTEVKPADLSKAITDYITKDYAGYTVQKAFKADAKGVITWEVEIMKGHEMHMLVFDKDGKFIKKEMVKHEGAKPVEKKPTKTTEEKQEPAPKK